MEENFIFSEKEDHIEVKKSGVTFFVWKHKSSVVEISLGLNLKDKPMPPNIALELCNLMNQNCLVVKFCICSDVEDDICSVISCSYEFSPNETTTSQDFYNVFNMLDQVSDNLFAIYSEFN